MIQAVWLIFSYKYELCQTVECSQLTHNPDSDCRFQVFTSAVIGQKLQQYICTETGRRFDKALCGFSYRYVTAR